MRGIRGKGGLGVGKDVDAGNFLDYELEEKYGALCSEEGSSTLCNGYGETR